MAPIHHPNNIYPGFNTPHWISQPEPEPKKKERARFEPPRLPYSFNALEPIVDCNSLKDHFYNFHMRFFEEFYELINDTRAEFCSVQTIMKEMSTYSDEMMHCVGGWYNHQLFWENLSPHGGEVSDLLEKAINKQFGNIYSFKMEFIKAALKKACCGWAWLIADEHKNLKISVTKGNMNPLMDIAEEKGTPLLVIDIWEHAYYGKYQSDCKQYLSALWMMINWNEVSDRYDRI
jgi:superoxide dismutase, Fe-Mn family